MNNHILMKETRPEIKNEYRTPSRGEDAELFVWRLGDFSIQRGDWK